MGILTRIGRAPGVRRLVRRQDAPGVVRENPDDEDWDPLWCSSCRREVLFEEARCRRCGGQAVTAHELARRSGDLPPAGRRPTDW